MAFENSPGENSLNHSDEKSRQREAIEAHIILQSKEKARRVAELQIAKNELRFQDKEKAKRAAELEVANKELVFQSAEKAKRAAELEIANAELLFQSAEKAKRAAELEIANAELLFQNSEKAKRAAELEIANKELLYQSDEKAKRAVELEIAYKELKQLLQLNSDKDRFISILAHDLTNPFNSILGFCELLLKNIRVYKVDEMEQYMNRMYLSAQNTHHLLVDLLKWTRAQSGRMEFEAEDLNFSDFCTANLAMFNPIVDNKHIEINYYIEDDITVFADRHMLKAICRNLISNAIKFSNEGGQVDVSAENDPENVIITVSDQGVGMSTDNVNKLFHVSQMQSTPGTAHEKGTGLGLLLCKEFVERHGGNIFVESESGVGSSFKFSLPHRH